MYHNVPPRNKQVTITHTSPTIRRRKVEGKAPTESALKALALQFNVIRKAGARDMEAVRAINYVSNYKRTHRG